MNTTQNFASTNSRGAQQAMISPGLDFFFVGGGSIIALMIIFLIKPVVSSDYQAVIATAAAFAYIASFFVNYPHFAFSYQVFYRGFWRRLRDGNAPKLYKWRMAISGIVVPLAIIYYLMAAMIIFPESSQWMVSAMFFFVGWHYVKQGYGVLITLSVYKKVFYKSWEKKLLIANCYLVWIFIWLSGHYFGFENDYYGISYQTFIFPRNVIETAGWLSLLTTVAVLLLLLKIWLIDKRGLSLNGLVGYFCAVYLWMVFANIDPVFFAIVPFFHGLQYFPFIYRYRSNEIRSNGKNRGVAKPLLIFALTGVILGALFMDIGPKWADQWALSAGQERSFYLSCFLLFINIHHYFLDHAFWRKENREVQDNLFLNPA